MDDEHCWCMARFTHVAVVRVSVCTASESHSAAADAMLTECVRAWLCMWYGVEVACMHSCAMQMHVITQNKASQLGFSGCLILACWVGESLL